MAETSGSCGLAGRNRGITQSYFAPTKLPDFRTVISDAAKDYRTRKQQEEYERIMHIPKEDRTFAERMFVAQINTERLLDKIVKSGEPISFTA